MLYLSSPFRKVSMMLYSLFVGDEEWRIRGKLSSCRRLKIDKTVVIFDFFAVGAKQVWSFFFIFAAE
jgi:hypothetical protein